MSNYSQGMPIMANVGANSSGTPMVLNNSIPMPGSGGTGGTFVLNPSNAVANPHGQAINTQQLNHMIANSSLMNAQQQHQHLAQFQNQQQPSMVQAGQFGQMSHQVFPQHMMQASASLPDATQATNHNGFQQSAQHLNENGTIKEENSSSDQPQQLPVPPRPIVVLDRQRLQDLVKEVDPDEQLEEEVEDILLNIADDFIDSLVTTACMISKHRKSKSLDVNDVQLALEKNWNMWIPGFGIDGVVGVYTGGALGQNASASRIPKKSITTEAHRQRMALIRKSLKKV